MLSNTTTVCCICGANSKDNLKRTDSKLLLPEIPKSLKNKKKVITVHPISTFGGNETEWLEHRTCNLEAPSSSPTLTTSWICSR